MKKGIYKVQVARDGIYVSYAEVYRDAEGKAHVYIYRRVKQNVASESVFKFMRSHDCVTLRNGDYVYKLDLSKIA